MLEMVPLVLMLACGCSLVSGSACADTDTGWCGSDD
jgi:hypothetical protein